MSLSLDQRIRDRLAHLDKCGYDPGGLFIPALLVALEALPNQVLAEIAAELGMDTARRP